MRIEIEGEKIETKKRHKKKRDMNMDNEMISRDEGRTMKGRRICRGESCEKRRFKSAIHSGRSEEARCR